MESTSYLTTYQHYLQVCGGPGPDVLLALVSERIQHTNWDEPRSPVEWNNVAVLALVEADASDDPTVRGMYVDMAIAALSEGLEHPLCTAHLALVQSLMGDRDEAIQAIFSTLITSLLQVSITTQIPPGLIFLPQRWQGYVNLPYTQIPTVLNLTDGYQQSIRLAGEILCQSQFVFYNPAGLRFLQLATHLFPDSPLLNLNLGISSLMNAQWEGVLYLHQAHQLSPQNVTILHALALAYKLLGQLEIVQHWQYQAGAIALAAHDAATGSVTHHQSPQAATPDSTTEAPLNGVSADWTQLPLDHPFTYVPLQQSVQMAVEASFQSIVTAVLLAKGTWFEQEMEFWQDFLQPGMTVIDVGANVGVYTFSAAQRVGQTGRVLAIEPFSNCVQCLTETCRVNHLDWVTVCRGAASDRNGSAYLSLHAASELNELVAAPEATAPNVEEVPCFTLDALIEQEQIQQVDLLKIDAEGHELQVLAGSDRLLQAFAPVILYENIAGSQGSNLPVAEYLLTKGYQLFRYQPFIKQLHPVQLSDDLSGNLNIIAMPVRPT